MNKKDYDSVVETVVSQIEKILNPAQEPDSVGAAALRLMYEQTYRHDCMVKQGYTAINSRVLLKTFVETVLYKTYSKGYSQGFADGSKEKQKELEASIKPLMEDLRQSQQKSRANERKVDADLTEAEIEDFINELDRDYRRP